MSEVLDGIIYLDFNGSYSVSNITPGTAVTITVLAGDGIDLYTEGVTLTMGESAVVAADSSGDIFFNYFGGSSPVTEVSMTQEVPSGDLFSYSAIVPAAVSSELDESGEERIHIAPYADSEEGSPEPPTECAYIVVNIVDSGEAGGRVIYLDSEDDIIEPMPDWFQWGVGGGDGGGFNVRFPDITGDTYWDFNWISAEGRYRAYDFGDEWPAVESMEYSAQVAQPVDGPGDWSCLTVQPILMVDPGV